MMEQVRFSTGNGDVVNEATKPQNNRNYRLNWITERLIKNDEPVSILDNDFVMDYLDIANVKSSLMKYGAPKCKMLSADLSSLFKKGALRRSLCVLPPGSMNEGFPNWVYMYRICNVEFTG